MTASRVGSAGPAVSDVGRAVGDVVERAKRPVPRSASTKERPWPQEPRSPGEKSGRVRAVRGTAVEPGVPGPRGRRAGGSHRAPARSGGGPVPGSTSRSGAGRPWRPADGRDVPAGGPGGTESSSSGGPGVRSRDTPRGPTTRRGALRTGQRQQKPARRRPPRSRVTTSWGSGTAAPVRRCPGAAVGDAPGAR